MQIDNQNNKKLALFFWSYTLQYIKEAYNFLSRVIHWQITRCVIGSWEKNCHNLKKLEQKLHVEQKTNSFSTGDQSTVILNSRNTPIFQVFIDRFSRY